MFQILLFFFCQAAEEMQLFLVRFSSLNPIILASNVSPTEKFMKIHEKCPKFQNEFGQNSGTRGTMIFNSLYLCLSSPPPMSLHASTEKNMLSMSICHSFSVNIYT